MRVERGASQILFGLLPEQTADFHSSVWKVSRWLDPVPIPLDQEILRNELLKAIGPWAAQGQDGGFSQELYRGASVEVVGLNLQRGVQVEEFPKIWRCKACNRIHRAFASRCQCGSNIKAQLHYVAYHECGALSAPWLPRPCPTHNQIRVNLPGSASAREVTFDCPACARTLGRGLVRGRCNCGAGAMSVTVHRASSVYTPRFTVIVNPPDPAAAARIRGAGGPARALDWVVNGMVQDRPSEGQQTAAALFDTLRQTMSEDLAARLVEKAVASGEVVEGTGGYGIDLQEPFSTQAKDEALRVAFAVDGGRVRTQDLLVEPDASLRRIYEGYPNWLRRAGLEEVEFLSAFPVGTIAFGYSRGDVRPGKSRLVAFRERGRLRAYGSLSETEALLFRLDPIKVFAWLQRRGHLIGATADVAPDARLRILESSLIPGPGDEDPRDVGSEILKLVHSYAHRAVRRLSAFAGIERDSLAEYLLPRHLAFVIYASARGDFCMGGLQAVFETGLHRFLDDLTFGERRCPLDPGCASGGSACMACLHLGEPSCRWFNRFLTRDYLFGSDGYLTGTESDLAAGCQK